MWYLYTKIILILAKNDTILSFLVEVMKKLKKI